MLWKFEVSELLHVVLALCFEMGKEVFSGCISFNKGFHDVCDVCVANCDVGRELCDYP